MTMFDRSQDVALSVNRNPDGDWAAEAVALRPGGCRALGRTG